MTKQEFATRLLFWLLPWPISKALPRSLRILYYGPSGQWAPGWTPPWDYGSSGYYDPFRIAPTGSQEPIVPGPTNPWNPYVPGPFDKPKHTQPLWDEPEWIDATSPDYWDPASDDIAWDPINNWWKYRCSYESAHTLAPKVTFPWGTDVKPKYIKISHFGDCSEINLFIKDDVTEENNYLSGQVKQCDYTEGLVVSIELVSTNLSVPWANFGYITGIFFSLEEV